MAQAAIVHPVQPPGNLSRTVRPVASGRRPGLLNAPYPWLTIGNLHRLGEGPVWKADLRIAGAVCPQWWHAPYNYSLKVRASDGALEHTQSFVLAVTGCP